MDGEDEREFDALLEELRKTDLEENTDQIEQQIDVDTHPFAKEWSTLLDDPMKLIDVDIERILGLEVKHFLHRTVGTIRSDGKYFWKGVIFAGLAEAKDIEGLLPEDVLSQHLAKLYPNHKVEGGPCRAVVNDDRFVYRCLDCMKNQGALMCPGCYDKDRHENHLVWRETRANGYCDCGDSEYWDPKGNCSAHSGFVQEDTVLSDETKKRLTKVVGMAYYCICQIHERALLFIESPRPADIPEPVFQKVNSRIQKLRDVCIPLIGNNFLLNLTQIIQGVAGQMQPHPQLGGVFGDILTTPLCTLCPGKPLMMFHRHDDYARPQPLSSEPQPCECTISQLILRYCTTIEQYVKDGELTKHLQVLIHNERFRLKFAVDYQNHFGFFVKFRGADGKDINGAIFSNLPSVQYMLLHSSPAVKQIIASPLFTQGMQALEYWSQRVINYSSLDGRFRLNKRMQYVFCEAFGTPEMAETLLSTPSLGQIVVSAFTAAQQSRMSFIPGMDFSQDNELLNQQMIHSTQDQRTQTNGLYRMNVLFRELMKINSKQKRADCIKSWLRLLADRLLTSNDFSSDDTQENCSFNIFLEIILSESLMLCYNLLRPNEEQNNISNNEKRKLLTKPLVRDSLREIGTLIGLEHGDTRKMWRRLFSSHCRVIGLYREISRGLWSFYGPIATEAQTNFNTEDQWVISMFGAQMAAVALQGEDLWGLAVRSFFTDNIYGKFDIDLKNLVDGQSDPKPFVKNTQGKDEIQKLIALLSDFLKTFSKLLLNGPLEVKFNHTMLKKNIREAAKGILEVSPEFQSEVDPYLLAGSLLLCPMKSEGLCTQLNVLAGDPGLVDEFMDKYLMLDPVTEKVTVKPHILSSLEWCQIDFNMLWDADQNSEELFAEIPMKVPKGKHSPIAVPPVTILSSSPVLNEVAKNLNTYGGLERMTDLIHELDGWAQCVEPFCRLVLILLAALERDSPTDQTVLEMVFERADRILSKMPTIGPNTVTQTCVTFSSKFREIRGRCLKINTVSKSNPEDQMLMDTETPADLASDKSAKLQQIFEQKRIRSVEKLKLKKEKFYEAAAQEMKDMISQIMTSQSADELRCPRTNEVIDRTKTYFLTGQIHNANAILIQARLRASTLQLEKCMQDAQETMDSEMYDKLKGLVNMLGNHEYLGHEQMIITTCGHCVSTDSNHPIRVAPCDMMARLEIPCDVCKYPSNIKIPIFPAELYQSWLKCDEPKKDNLKLSAVFEALLSSDNPTVFMESATSALRQNSPDTKPLIIKYSQELLKFHALLYSYTKTYTAHIQRARTINGGSQPLGLESSVELGFLMSLSEIRSFGSIIKGHAQVYFSLYQIKRMRCIMVFQHEHGTPPTRALENWMQELKSSIGQLKAILRLLREGFTEANLVNLPINELYCSLTVKLLELIPHELDLRHLIQELTELFANLKFKQQLLRRGMPLTTTWDDVRYDTNKRADFVNSMLKLLRMAALLKYIMQYPELSKSKQCEKLISANLMGEDKEIELLAIFLNVQITATGLSTSLADVLQQLETDDMSSQLEVGIQKQYECHSAYDTLIASQNIEPSLTFTHVNVNQDLGQFFKQYFNLRCNVCKKMGIMAMCLFCGEAVCCSYCGEKRKMIPDGAAQMGPCSAHAILKHGGYGAFIHLDEGSVFIYEADRMHHFKESWRNKFGASIDTSKKLIETFAKYSFNHSLLDTIRSGFLNFNILNMITSYSWKSNLNYRNRFY